MMENVSAIVTEFMPVISVLLAVSLAITVADWVLDHIFRAGREDY